MKLTTFALLAFDEFVSTLAPGFRANPRMHNGLAVLAKRGGHRTPPPSSGEIRQLD